MGTHAPRHPAASPLIVPDLRTPGQPMATLPVKIPAACFEALQWRAERLNTSRGALARMLLVQGLERLETAAAAAGEVE